jgi:thiol:disulfide interchange protein
MNPVLRSALRTFPIALFLLVAALADAAGAQNQPVVPQDNQSGAKDVLQQSEAAAAAQHKNVLLVFSASWCGPCRMFEELLQDPNTGTIIGKYFVIARLDVGEKPKDTRHSNTPGAEALLASLDGGRAGYPFIVFLDPSGKPIVNSLRPVKGHATGDNIGYPAVPVEIDWFMNMLHQGAPGLSSKEADMIQAWLQQRGHA